MQATVRLQGDVVELIRWVISYQTDDEVLCRNEAVFEAEKDAICQGLSAQGIEFSVEALDISGHEWIEGLKFENWDDANAAFHMGEVGYNEFLYKNDTALQTAEYLTFLEYELLKLKWGLE